MTKRILVVEDQEGLRDVLRTLLRVFSIPKLLDGGSDPV